MDFQTVPCIPTDQMKANINNALKQGYPIIKGPQLPKGASWVIPLAIVGGSPSVMRFAKVLQEWPGTIWAINGAWSWCRENGIEKASLFSVDPHPCLAEIVRGKKLNRAILGPATDPGVFEAIEKPADVAIFDVSHFGFETGPTSATTAVTLAPLMGYSAVNFFGCESSYPPQSAHHVYAGDEDPAWMKISTHGGEFTTKSEWFLQAQTLATVIRTFPRHYKHHGGGLLGALIEDPSWEISCVSPELHKGLQIPEGVTVRVQERP